MLLSITVIGTDKSLFTFPTPIILFTFPIAISNSAYKVSKSFLPNLYALEFRKSTASGNTLILADVVFKSRLAYRIIVEKEYDFIRSNQDDVIRHATVLYNQKTRENILYTGPNASRKPGYLSAAVDFKYAEQMHDKYIQEHDIH